LVSVIPAPPSYPALPAPGENLTLGTVCPAATDHRTTLAISFELLNLTANDVTVIGVTPRLPLGGLRARGPTTAGGSCRKPGADAAGGLITAGQKRLFTMRFRLPKVCPTPLPVQAAVRLTVDQMVGTTTVPVLSDLGSVEFDSCP
jgi:hypothetical protein